jgi:ABC-type Fe3+ transport system permease subunit
VLLGLLSLATVPTAIVFSNASRRYELLDAAYAIPLGLVLGLAAILLARRARRRAARSVTGTRGLGAARAGRLLGLAGFLLAVTAAMAVGVYELLAAVDA